MDEITRVVSTIEKATTEEEVIEILADKLASEVLNIARALDVYPKKKNRNIATEAILNATVRAKHRSNIIRNYKLR